MKKIALVAAFFLVTHYSFAQKSTDDFTGTWRTKENKNVVFSRTQTGFTAVAEQKNRTVIKEIQFTDGKWKGIIITPKGESLACELLLKASTLEITVKKGMFSKKLEWTKP